MERFTELLERIFTENVRLSKVQRLERPKSLEDMIFLPNMCFILLVLLEDMKRL